MKPKSFSILLALFFFVGAVNAQSQLDEKPEVPEKSIPEGTSMNIVKLNLPALAFSNFSLQYERIINKRFSAAMGIRFMPKTGLPFKNTFVNLAGTDNPDVTNTINNLKVSKFCNYS